MKWNNKEGEGRYSTWVTRTWSGGKRWASPVVRASWEEEQLTQGPSAALANFLTSGTQTAQAAGGRQLCWLTFRAYGPPGQERHSDGNATVNPVTAQSHAPKKTSQIGLWAQPTVGGTIPWPGMAGL